MNGQNCSPMQNTATITLSIVPLSCPHLRHCMVLKVPPSRWWVLPWGHQEMWTTGGRQWALIHKTLNWAKEKYKLYAEKGRAPEWDIQVGDSVYLSTKNLKGLQPRRKLGWKYVGPFTVVRKINDVTVELNLPKSLKGIHPIFHFSLLKRDPGPKVWKPRPAPPPPTVDGEPHHEAAQILDSIHWFWLLQESDTLDIQIKSHPEKSG